MIRPTSANAEEVLQQPPAAAMAEADYPPALTGLRGSNAGSMDVAHSMRDGKRWDTGDDTGEAYDLVVVGAGMSGLAAAYFFRKKTVPDAKILILDNHDDFRRPRPAERVHRQRPGADYEGRDLLHRATGNLYG